MADWAEKWKRERERRAFIALDDGAVFRGTAFGAAANAVGEAVFNTGMCGYQEILTDPSYAGQLVALTTAEVGNYGTNRQDAESRGLFLSALAIGDLTEPSNCRSEKSLDGYLKENGVCGIYGVDTRALALHIREHGNRRAFVCALGDTTPEEAAAKARAWEGLDGIDYASKVTCAEAFNFPGEAGGGAPFVVCIDFGVKRNILRSLAQWARVRVVPARTRADEILAMKPDGVFLSNGPGDPAAVTYAIDAVRGLLAAGIPLMGICLGHQLLALACGAKTQRLKFGHHGCNHPVKELATGRTLITSQNHNFAVDAGTMPDCLETTHVNLNDGTVEGLRHRTLPAFSLQFHPEACPGPHDGLGLFDEWRRALVK